jgi:hypothetical protein
MHIYVCKNLANFIQKICTPKNNLRSETMKTYILASIFTNEEGLEIFKKNNEYQGVNWVSGAPDVKYRKYDNDEEFTSNADTRRENFSKTVWELIYEGGRRYYGDSPKGFNPITNAEKQYQCDVKGIQFLFAEESICVDGIVPGLVVLELFKEEGGNIHVEEDDIYKYLSEEKMIPVGYIIGNSKNDDLKGQMWQHNVKPFVYRLSIVDAFESVPKKNPREYTETEKKDFWRELHYYATGKKPSARIREKWSQEEPAALKTLGEGDWCIYTRSQGICYYAPDINGDNYKNQPICFQGYAESFHLDAIMLSILKNSLVSYYLNQIQKYVLEDNRGSIRDVNNKINRMYIMYDMGRTNPRGGQHFIVMEEVEEVLHFGQNLKELMDSAGKIEEISSNQRQEDIAKYALWVAIIMIVPAVVALLNDGTANLEKHSLASFIYYGLFLLFIYIVVYRIHNGRFPNIFKCILSKLCEIVSKSREKVGKLCEKNSSQN